MKFSVKTPVSGFQDCSTYKNLELVTLLELNAGGQKLINRQIRTAPRMLLL